MGCWGRILIRIIQGDVREELPKLSADFFDCVVTSPPYFGLRDYGCAGQIGIEPTLDGYLDTMVVVCRELRRVLKPSGVMFLNIGDSYYRVEPNTGKSWRGKRLGSRDAPERMSLTLKPKDLCLVPQRLGIRLQEDGWWVRSHIIWHKANPMPESVTDRPTSAHETIWMLTKSERYYWDADAVAERAETSDSRKWTAAKGSNAMDESALRNDKSRHGGGSLGNPLTRNIRNVWTIAIQPFAEAHFATFPPELAERCVKAACPIGGHVLDPFGGAGTTGLVADRLGRDATLIELNPAYANMAKARIQNDAPLFVETTDA